MRILFVLPLLLFTFNIYSQDFQGEATYVSNTTVDIDLSEREIPEERKEQIIQRMKEANERTYILTFDRFTSNYNEEEREEQSRRGRGRMRFGMMDGASKNYYKDVKEGKYLVQNELLGRSFLIEDKLPKLDWKLEAETKQIGNYTAQKATAKKVIARPNLRGAFRRGEDNPESEEDVFLEKEVEIVAWYTMDIPVNQGPGEYWGLPGLILEISDDITVIRCNKIVLNPVEKKEINAPAGGKKLTQAEYDKIYKEKVSEMRARFRSGNGGRRGRP
ncbi:GLPGLI family protein [Arenibacter latericius]|uniref:GLPGLI family protein n=1 Tax=Arenibacter latericius TaxID=86104 RepID=UPI0003F74E73|nr:GLPGLI family protein [Arenibacter latericius]MDX1362765.1 GLPGLI family protein [Arenibacter latericius]